MNLETGGYPELVIETESIPILASIDKMPKTHSIT